MFSASRLCFNKTFGQSTKLLINGPTRYFTQCNVFNRPVRPLFRSNLLSKQSFIQTLKNTNIFRSSGTVAVRLTSDVATKGQKAVGYWLLGCGGMVFVAVVLGGVTRLTESGLSMVTWKFFGEKMPRTNDEWEREFKNYQEYPEFKIKNKEITLGEFKNIWHMEYSHRMWGRAIGAVFLIPAAFFWARGMLRPGMKPRVLIFGSLIAGQGLMGWCMVKSGLEDRFHGASDVPRVSQYRLAAHLGLAFGLYTLFLSSALDHLLPPGTVSVASKAAIQSARRFRMFAHSCKGMVFLTAISGAFVAGLDAGLVYNSFPKMADRWIPEDVMALSPPIVNFTENPTTVQLDHRILGSATLALVTAGWLMSRGRVLPPRVYLATNILCAMTWLQVALGITTLLTYVPVPLAASHQSGSLFLLSIALWLCHELKRLPK